MHVSWSLSIFLHSFGFLLKASSLLIRYKNIYPWLFLCIILVWGIGLAWPQANQFPRQTDVLYACLVAFHYWGATGLGPGTCFNIYWSHLTEFGGQGDITTVLDLYLYSISRRIYAVYCCGYMSSFYPYTSGLLHRHWGNWIIAPVPVKQPWRIWVKSICTKLEPNTCSKWWKISCM